MHEQTDYNEWFRQMVKKHCPDLFDEMQTRAHHGTEYINGVINDPRGDQYRIDLSTYGCELTISCHAWHSHFDQFSDDDHENEFLNAIDWIKQFRADEIVIFTEYDGGRVVQAVAAEPGFRFRPSQAKRAEVFSFSGKLDRTIAD